MAHVLRIAALACAAVLAAAAADNQLTAEEKSAGWRLLSTARLTPDGKTRAEVADGRWVHHRGRLSEIATQPKINEDLFTLETFSDFEMEFDWKDFSRRQQRREVPHTGPRHAGRPEARAVVRGPGERVDEEPANGPAVKGQEYVIGFEYQVLDTRRIPMRCAAQPSGGRALRHAPAAAGCDQAGGRIHHSRLVVKGDAVEHWLNGVKVVDGSLTAPEVAKGTGARWERTRRCTSCW